MEVKDIQGNYDLTISAKGTESLSNICSFCGKCAECEHPNWVCPKLEEIKKKLNV